MMGKVGKFIRQNKQFTVFGVLAFVIVLIAVFAPLIAPYDPYVSDLSGAYGAPSAEHPFGTDSLGRDMLSRVIYGTRISLASAVALVLIVFVVGSVLGAVAGYYGGVVDAVIMRISDMMISFPGIVLAIAVAGLLGASVTNAIIALAVVSWTKYARLSRSLALKIRHTDFIEAAEVNGTKPWRLIVRYIVPNALPTLVITAATDIGTMILELAGLSFLGFGAQPPAAEWGLMLNQGRPYMLSSPWLMIFPGIAIALTVVVFNLFGDSLRDVLDPRSKKREPATKGKVKAAKVEKNVEVRDDGKAEKAVNKVNVKVDHAMMAKGEA